MQMNSVGWLDVSMWLIMEINYICDRSYFVDPAAVSGR